MEYKGITPEALFLLADNRFRNSKEYYESRKEEIKSGVTEPMRQLAGLIGGELLSVKPLYNLFSLPAWIKICSRNSIL